MASSLLARAALTGTAVLSLFVATAACDDRRGYYGRYDRCDYTYRQCRTVCDYWCDYWSCYPTCWDQCWDECGYNPRPPASSSTSTSGAPSPGIDAGVVNPDPDPEPEPGTGVLCTPCDANSDCESGAVCILRGGPPRDTSADDSGAPIGRGFCGHACTTSADCPDGFLCSQLGSSRQCLPKAGSCD
ncbi:MAG: hypothetical protein KIT84_03340 [Labilithrix sp.]|nr:hypothetical protein [Labilithrix sp.]MCW5810017.1 hypothetical protein [Labilithrix sp.]